MPNPPPATTIALKIDRRLKRDWQAQLTRLEHARREGAGAFDEYWEAVSEIVDHDPPLFLAGGISTLEDFLRRHVRESRRTAMRMIRVARFATPAEEARYGASKLDAALGFLEARAGAPLRAPLPVDFGKLRIPVERPGGETRVALADATVDELRRATRRLLAATRRAPHPRATPEVLALRAALTAAHLPRVAVRRAGDRLLFDVPLADLHPFARALAAAKLPASANVGPRTGNVGTRTRATAPAKRRRRT